MTLFLFGFLTGIVFTVIAAAAFVCWLLRDEPSENSQYMYEEEDDI